MALTPKAWKEARDKLQSLISTDNPTLQKDAQLRQK